MSNLAFLEPFDAISIQQEASTPLHEQPAYQSGFEDGVAQAETIQASLTAEVVEKVSDMAFTYAEARQELVAQIKVFFDALSHQVLPGLSNEIERAHISEVLHAAADSSLKGPVIIRVPPQSAKALNEAVPDALGMPLQFVEDAKLEGPERLVQVGELETLVDISELTKSLSEIFLALNTLTVEDAKHG